MPHLRDRVRRQVEARGVVRASFYMIARVALLIVLVVYTPVQHRRVRGVRELDKAYDDRGDVDTSGEIHPGELGVHSARRRFAVSYIASVPDEFRRTLQAVELDHPRFTFVDLGSGKGRAVLMAMALPFKRVIGIEFSPKLHAIAMKNLERYRGERRSGHVELVCQDAAEWQPPEDPLAIYMYNPFQAEVLREVVANVLATAARSPRPIYLFYCNPVHDEVLSGEPLLERVAAGDLFAVYRVRTGLESA